MVDSGDRTVKGKPGRLITTSGKKKEEEMAETLTIKDELTFKLTRVDNEDE